MQKATALPRGSGFSLGGHTVLEFRWFALFTAIATYGLIVLGGVVRATDSGTACPDWPLCHGQVIPPFETKVLIEFSHRLVASVVGLLILITALWAWRRYREHPVMPRAAVTAALLLTTQVIVGGVTVGTETQASVVAMHLTIALGLLATLITIVVEAFIVVLPGAARAGSQVSLLGVTALIATFVLIISGAYVSQTGAGLAYPDWPLFDGKLVSAGGRLADLHYAHRLIAATVGVLLLTYVARTLRGQGDPLLRTALVSAFGLYVAQVLLGASNIWFDLATSVRIAHLALASALWGVLVFGVAWASRSWMENVEGTA